MNKCSEWREAIFDHALGLPASEALQAHLENCATCSEALGELRSRANQLDAGVRQLVRVDPSPNLGSRVMARIRSASPQTLWATNWRLALAAVAVTILLATANYVVRWRVEAREQERKLSSIASALSHWRSPTDSLLRSSADSLLKSVPRLGEAYFELKPISGAPAFQKGEENAD